jgi:hypothetical protein
LRLAGGGLRIDERWIPFLCTASLSIVAGTIYLCFLWIFLSAHVPPVQAWGLSSVIRELRLVIDLARIFGSPWGAIAEVFGLISLMLCPSRGTFLGLRVVREAPLALKGAAFGFLLFLVASLMLENWVANSVVGPPSPAAWIVRSVSPFADVNYTFVMNHFDWITAFGDSMSLYLILTLLLASVAFFAIRIKAGLGKAFVDTALVVGIITMVNQVGIFLMDDYWWSKHFTQITPVWMTNSLVFQIDAVFLLAVFALRFGILQKILGTMRQGEGAPSRGRTRSWDGRLRRPGSPQ